MSRIGAARNDRRSPNVDPRYDCALAIDDAALRSSIGPATSHKWFAALRRVQFSAVVGERTMDPLSRSRRSWLMSRVKGKDTAPEIRVRKVVHALGYRFRLHQDDLPGSPDLVFPKLKSIIFVHGCFWHRHNGCSRASLPSTRRPYWERKFERNVARDILTNARLKSEGWRVLIIWECQTKDESRLRTKLMKFLSRANQLKNIRTEAGTISNGSIRPSVAKTKS
jgi:DNA mismatch endonuclease (patch repair protein)